MAKHELNQLIKEGLLGPVFGSRLSSSCEERDILGAIIRASSAATKKASLAAMKTKQPFLIAENGKVYEVQPSGEKKFIKELETPTNDFPNNFILP
ncbi:MAG: hypothetical protein IPN54_10930 [Bacteroidetes bacterium]|nr:hypothetical protein [Bacteroidota bacterium]